MRVDERRGALLGAKLERDHSFLPRSNMSGDVLGKWGQGALNVEAGALLARRRMQRAEPGVSNEGADCANQGLLESLFPLNV